jgi:hypothetical protein
MFGNYLILLFRRRQTTPTPPPITPDVWGTTGQMVWGQAVPTELWNN